MQPERSLPEVKEFVVRSAGAAEAGPLCSICQTAICAAESIGPCPSCSSTFHEDCWKENGGCAVYGCASMPRTVKDENPAFAPQSYWGQEQKACPKCNQQIKVAAVRCRFCGTTFDTAAPISARELREKQRSQPEREALKKTTITVFICGIIPFLAPLAALFGGVWYLRRRKEIGKLPAMNRVLCIVGLLSAVLCTGLFILLMILN